MKPKKLIDVPFTFDVELKAAAGNVVEKLESGDLLIEGWGSTLDVDREDEAFTDNAFTKGLSKFLAGGAPLCWHHKYDQVIGKVVHAERIPGRGVWVKAIVDHQPESSPLFHAYQAIKKGRATGLSVGGIFKRIITPEGPRIQEVDILEWSATATPVGSTATFSVVATKALQVSEDATNPEEVTNEEPEVVTPEVEKVEENIELAAIVSAVTSDSVFAEEVRKLTGVEPGSITTEHLSDELRSRFSELKVDTGPTMEDLSSALTTFAATLEQVAERVGIKIEPELAQPLV